MEPFNIFETGGREKFLKKKKEKKVKVETESRQQSQILMIQKNIRRFIELKRYFDHIDCQIELEEVEDNEGNLLQESSDKRSEMFYYWLLSPYKIRQDDLQYKLIEFWQKNVLYFGQNELFINNKNNNNNLLSKEYEEFNNNSLLLRMMKLTVTFLGDIFIIDEREGINVTKRIIDMYRYINANVEEEKHIEEAQARTLLQTLDNINSPETKRLRIEFIDSLLELSSENNNKNLKHNNNIKLNELCMKLLSEEKLFMEYLLAKDKFMDKSFIKDVVVGCYVNVLLERVKDKSYVSKIAQTTQDYRDNFNNNDINFESLCSAYNKILKLISSSESNLSSYSLEPAIQNNNELQHQQKTILMCLLRDLAIRMKQITIQEIISKYKINPKIFDSDTEYREYLEEKDEYLILREEMMGEYERSKRLIKESLELLLMMANNNPTNKREEQSLILSTSPIGINNNNNHHEHMSLIQPLVQETAFEYIYELLTVLGDVEILPLDKAIKLFVESVNEVMIYNLGKESILSNNSNNLSLSTTTSTTVENKFLLLLTLIEKSTQETPDLHFIKLYQSQENKETLKKLIKEYLLKMLKHLMFLPYPTISTTKIVTITTAILENLYNKIFRTNILSTEIFENTSFIMKFKNYSFKTNTKDEISQFLIQFPYVFPLAMRADKFKEIIRLERQRYQYHGFHLNDDDSDDDYYGRNVKIRRNHEFEDAFEQLRKKDLRKPFKITFINQLGFEEKGIDAGGLKKEFLNRVLKDALNPKNGLFIENSNHELLPHPTKAELNEGLFAEYYEFIGKLIGLAIYSNITLGYKFSGTFLNAIVGKKNCFDDLRTIDPSLYKSLIYIKDMEEDARELELTFLYQDEARNRLIQLLPNGHSIPVTNENKRLYISLLTGYKVNRSLEHQTRFIRKGLTQMINKECLFMFNYEELNYLISGQGKIDVDDLKYHTKVVGFDEKSTTIKNFWEVVREFDEDQKSKLLMFVTACPRPSFLGFRELSPPFTIACMKDKEHLLPISHTCSNVLELPEYKDREELKKKLLTAIESNAGFEFG